MNPSDYDADDALSPIPPVPPSTGTPKVIGTLSIIIAVCLLLCGACSGLYVAMGSALGPLMAAQQPQIQAQMEAQHRAQLQAELQPLQEREKAANTDKEKAEIQAQIKAIQARPVPKMPDMSKMTAMWTDSRVQAYLVTDLLTGMVLNVLLLIAGIGLINLKEWARVMGLWVFGLKFILLVVINSVGILLIVPIMTQKFIDFLQAMAKDMPPGQRQPGPGQLEEAGATMGTMMTVPLAGVLIIGVLVWGIMWLFLSRPGVKAACRQPRPLPAD